MISDRKGGSGHLRLPESVQRRGPPIGFPPSKNWMLPVGVPKPAVETVAVNVTGWPKTDGFALEVTVVVVGVARFEKTFPGAEVPAAPEKDAGQRISTINANDKNARSEMWRSAVKPFRSCRYLRCEGECPYIELIRSPGSGRSSLDNEMSS